MNQGVEEVERRQKILCSAAMAQAVERLPDDPNELKAMLLAERAQRAPGSDHQGDAAPSLRAARRDASRRSDAARARRGRADGSRRDGGDGGQSAAEREKAAGKRRTNLGALAAHLLRTETIVDIDPAARALHRIGEDDSERLDIVPTQFRVLATRHPKYVCRACESGVVQVRPGRG